MFIINAKSLGIAGGIVWAASLLLLTWIHLFTGYGAIFLNILTDLYPGYSLTFFGAFIGAFWGFIDMFCFLFLIAWIYNFIEH